MMRKFFHYWLFFLLLLVGAGVFFEFIFGPLLAWISGVDGYYLPSVDRLYKWLKLIGIITWPCALAMVFYEKNRSR